LSTITITRTVSESSDDAEERANGSLTLTSTDLELVQEKSTQHVGIRFVNPGIPTNATIVSAYIQFTTDEAVNQDQTTLLIYGEASANPTTFETSITNISSRPKTVASSIWQPMEWNSVWASGLDQRTSDLAVIVQELINQNGYIEDNPLVFLIEGTGKRVAESFDGSSQHAPMLVVTYSEGTNTYDCPQLGLNIGAPCDDNNNFTINDVVSGSCACEGETVTPSYDCPNLELNYGEPCDDGNPNTTNDMVQNDCTCSGNIPLGFACSRISATEDA